MPALLLTNTAVAVPALVALRDQWRTIFTATPTNTDYSELTFAAAGAGTTLRTVSPEDLFAEAAEQLAADPSLLLVSFGFGARIPQTFLAAFGARCFNVHFSLLPRYSGPIPVFWQLRAGDLAGGITIHQVTERLDAGPIVAQQEVRAYPGETFGLYSARLAQAAIPMLRTLLTAVHPMELRPQNPATRSYQSRPRERDLLVDWLRMTAADIENLVNACNPVAGGAWTHFAGTPLQLVEVSPATGSLPGAPGTIVHADPAQGLFVNCADDCLIRINVAKLPQGIVSGGKLAALGFRKGSRFENAAAVADRSTVTF